MKRLFIYLFFLIVYFYGVGNSQMINLEVGGKSTKDSENFLVA